MAVTVKMWDVTPQALSLVIITTIMEESAASIFREGRNLSNDLPDYMTSHLRLLRYAWKWSGTHLEFVD
jgi:hypothetical protein